jgi:aspartyl-tRNA(Asn)/glutamyl-tRNA(Gln) amidotransferase subunit A
MSVPCGLSDDGLPVGFQIMAPVLADDRLYRVGAALEKALDTPALLDEVWRRG